MDTLQLPIAAANLHGTGLRTIIALAAAGSMVVTAALSYYFLVYRPKHFAHSPRGLFRQLCRIHQLNGSQCGLLEKLATASKVVHPAILFLDAHAWSVIDDKGSEGLSEKQKAALIKLRPMLFTHDQVTTPAPQAAAP